MTTAVPAGHSDLASALCCLQGLRTATRPLKAALDRVPSPGQVLLDSMDRSRNHKARNVARCVFRHRAHLPRRVARTCTAAGPAATYPGVGLRPAYRPCAGSTNPRASPPVR